jgi:2-dehydro-3-deoxy-D-gluconate 5-dehydrogenase
MSKANNELINLTGKTALVTGAVGIGFGIGLRLAEAGAHVVFASINEEEAIESATVLSYKGFTAHGVDADVSNETSVLEMVEKTLSLTGTIDILVNNAGIYPSKPVSEMSLLDFEKVININLKGVFLCTKYVSAEMIKRNNGGKIINITSIDALHPSSIGLAHYDASKHGVWGFTKNVALELAPHKIWVNAIAPGAILTPGVKHIQKGNTNILDEYAKQIPMKRLGEPDDIGKVALFLASDMSSYITGTQIVVDGGLLLT